MHGGQIVLERRQHPRNRVYYGGMVAFNARNSTLDCLVRNFSPRGAKIEFENSAILPDRIDFEVERRGLSCLARLVWRDQNTAGLMFSEEREMGDVVSLDWARKLRASERTNRRLKSRLDQILSEH
jgi:PilZ domain-containing protein